jgi:hypothetical protein
MEFGPAAGWIMRKARTLISSPLEWRKSDWGMSTGPVRHPVVPVLAERGGTQLHTPLPVAIIDTREQNPLSFRRFKGWFASIENRALPLGDYSVSGMEDSCVVERKDLADLICSFSNNRTTFVARLRKMSQLPHSLLVVTAPLSQIKSAYPYGRVNPNHVTQSLVAVLAVLTYTFRLHRNARTGGGNRSVLPLPDVPL